MRKWHLVLLAVGCVLGSVQAAEPSPRNVVLVTLDGMRWQEVFRGIDARLAADDKFNRIGPQLSEMFGAQSPAESARKLFPFLHGVIEKQGVLLGNRDAHSCAHVTNAWYFSYPGYNEILTGKPDDSIDSNEAKPNRNVTWLEWLHNKVPAYRGKVAAFGSWSAFPAIINTERSGVPVIVGPPPQPKTAEEKRLAQLETNLVTLFPKVRLDGFTQQSALQALLQQKPRVMFVAFDETDDFAHEGHYEQYLLAAHRADDYLRQLWSALQRDPFYKNNTVLFVTTDHGRGEQPAETWQHHASKASLAGYEKSLARYTDGIVGSDAVWMAAIGIGVPARGPTATDGCVGSNQIAATLLTLLGLQPNDFSTDIGAPIAAMLP
ncbi:MAG TPA: alkaline phosphatase family protein [Candidatus Acidoferrum sp.]|nr:alkaline phosphatase family protein [Candidatus Acidoferrum sp.]